MSDDELRHLSPEQVVAVVRRLEARVAELEAELARRGGPPKTPENSSTPPSQGWGNARAARPPTGRNAGRRSGIWGRAGGEPSRTGWCCGSRPTVPAAGRTWRRRRR